MLRRRRRLLVRPDPVSALGPIGGRLRGGRGRLRLVRVRRVGVGIRVGGLVGWVLLGSVWAVALLGAAGKLLLASTWDRLAVPLYLVLGWVGIVMMKPLAETVTPVALVLLWVGGVLYSVGVLFHLWRSLPYQNAIWHVFVLAGTGCHFGAVTSAVFV